MLELQRVFTRSKKTRHGRDTTRNEKVACSSQVTSSTKKPRAAIGFRLFLFIANPAQTLKWGPFGDRSGIFCILGLFYKHFFQRRGGLAVRLLQRVGIDIHGG